MTTRATMMLNAIARMSTLYIPRMWQGADKVSPAVFPASADALRAERSRRLEINVSKRTSRLDRPS